MTQVKLPPYHGPCIPLDVVAIEIVFGCIFEAFLTNVSAATTDAAPNINNKLLKKSRSNYWNLLRRRPSETSLLWW
jgi:hypothetical protein